MTRYKYLIVGGGMTADAAIGGVREVDASGSLALIGSEPDRPYNRPPLSKGLWKDQKLESIWRQGERAGVEWMLGRTVTGLDPRAKQVTDDQGSTFQYEKLLLATGGTPRRLPFGGEDVIYFRTLADYTRLRALAERGQRFAVIGGGFIGSEVAAALAMNGKEVTMIFPDKTLCSRVFPADLGASVGERYRQEHVELIGSATVQGIEKRGAGYVLQIRNATGAARPDLEVDGVIAGIGITPDVELARAAGAQVENGIVVDEYLSTGIPDVYAAGDVASFPNRALGRRMRFEHEDNANTMGALAGRNLAGDRAAYDHLPFFYSDLFDLGYEAVGELDSGSTTVAHWSEPYRQGVVYYLRDGRVRGVLLWNVWSQVEAARRLIAEPGPFTAETLRGRLPE